MGFDSTEAAECQGGISVTMPVWKVDNFADHEKDGASLTWKTLSSLALDAQDTLRQFTQHAQISSRSCSLAHSRVGS